jgi:hypothetical protein
MRNTRITNGINETTIKINVSTALPVMNALIKNPNGAYIYFSEFIMESELPAILPIEPIRNFDPIDIPRIISVVNRILKKLLNLNPMEKKFIKYEKIMEIVRGIIGISNTPRIAFKKNTGGGFSK